MPPMSDTVMSTLSAPPAAAAPAAETAPAPEQTIMSFADTVARVQAAGASAAAKAQPTTAEPMPIEGDVPSDAVAEVPEPPAPSPDAPPVPEEKPDPIAAMEARIAEMQAGQAALLAQIAALQKPAETKAEPAKEPEPTRPKSLPDPFEAQAVMYFGADLPKPLLAKATEALMARHGWQAEQRAAEAALAAGDATAKARLAMVEQGMASAQASLERIEYDAQIAKTIAQKPEPAQVWGVTARDTLVDSIISIPMAERTDWGDAATLPNHEIAMVLRAVPAGGDMDDYVERAKTAVEEYAAAKVKATKPAPAAAIMAKPTTGAKNPAPLAPPKVETPTAGPVWANDMVPDFHDLQAKVIARARGDRAN